MRPVAMDNTTDNVVKIVIENTYVGYNTRDSNFYIRKVVRTTIKKVDPVENLGGDC
jgi:hypothetical protein